MLAVYGLEMEIILVIYLGIIVGSPLIGVALLIYSSVGLLSGLT